MRKMINIAGNGLEILAAILFSLTVLMPVDFSKNCKRPGWFLSDFYTVKKVIISAMLTGFI